MIPTATYRLQLHAGFAFADAEAIIPYLAALGISHIYLSPVTTAAPASQHGYDVVDPTCINPELGGEEGLERLVETVRRHKLGVIIDIVPNHMGVAGTTNAYWCDLLARGADSPHARLFDVDWRVPIMLPVLATSLEEALEAGAIRLIDAAGPLALELYGSTAYPLRCDDPVLAEDRARALARHDPARPDGRLALANLIDRQHYRLIHWRAANDCLNWRRFFSINELAGVRIEDPDVFEWSHRLYFDLFARGLIDGVRVDHVDGLTDPATYCQRLRARFETLAPGRPAYIVVEKILGPQERLNPDWRTDGTTGYDFMREAGELIHDPHGWKSLCRLWESLSERAGDFATEALVARRELLAWQFEAQLDACVEAFAALAGACGERWIPRPMLRRAIERLLWVFPVYRTYGTGTDAPLSDKPVRELAHKAALPLMPPGEEPVLIFILKLLAGTLAAPADLACDAARRFQQLCAPIAAKGVEDTAFYRYGVLLSANDVGSDPGRFASDIATFHAASSARARHHPHAMLALSTHDHKRGADARARLAVLSSIPDIWADLVQQWLSLIGPAASRLNRGDIAILFQTLVGAWGEPSDKLLARIHRWQDKTLREAKLRSSWEAPQPDYEGCYRDLATHLLATPERADFRESFERFIRRISAPALANSLAQTGLQFLAPGVPDIYQGCETLDLSLVDPDNRRPVDFAARAASLSAGAGYDAKFDLVTSLLALRKDHCALRDGSYRPLRVVGPRSAHVVAFERALGDDRLTCAVAIRLGRALVDRDHISLGAEWWEDTAVIEDAGPRPVVDLLKGHVAVAQPTIS
ncbi:malto-oligosyltrehalose synthase [Sphingomonas crocodyli]|uniref:Malto-oligosyltrehalose synthase n=1 Tax=Sphingomonas crocodyli TaxID=1979270 RepID=A0A437LYK4_9SPHN|nr:malto-oligosyltrehalose synthase [Sphingomonas crocodyli]RVT90394.1 malto-oligosyltrehalose synthase [Sphingomonas crocodyli]